MADTAEDIHPELFPPLPVPPDLEVMAKERGWPDDLLQRAVDLRVQRDDLEWWLGEEGPPVGEIQSWVATKERLRVGTLRARKATVSDNDIFADLWANSSTDIGEWRVTVERSPNAFAQWRLQENVIINVLEDRGLLVASQCNSRRNTLVGGKRVTVQLPQGVRVRDGFRRLGYSQLVNGGGGGPHPNSPLENATYFYIRSQNFASQEWVKARNPGMFEGVPQPEDDVAGVDAIVYLIPAQAAVVRSEGIRLGEPRDLRRCVALINRTHRGLDLFRPYSEDFLENRLDDGGWSPKPDWYRRVYGWDDFFVLEVDGVIVACAGLWDRGRDMREVWRGPNDEVRTVDATALMDFGYARGHLDAMERLTLFLLNRTVEFEREHLLAPLQFLKPLRDRLAPVGPIPDRRGLVWTEAEPSLERPYTDLAYW